MGKRYLPALFFGAAYFFIGGGNYARCGDEGVKQPELLPVGTVYNYWKFQRRRMLNYDSDPLGRKALFQLGDLETRLARLRKQRDELRRRAANEKGSVRRNMLMSAWEELSETLFHLQRRRENIVALLKSRRQVAVAVLEALCRDEKKHLEQFIPISAFDCRHPVVRSDLRRILLDLPWESAEPLWRALCDVHTHLATRKNPLRKGPGEKKAPKKRLPGAGPGRAVKKALSGVSEGRLAVELEEVFAALGKPALNVLAEEAGKTPTALLPIFLRLLKKMGAENCSAPVLRALAVLDRRRRTEDRASARQIISTTALLLRAPAADAALLPHLPFLLRLSEDKNVVLSRTALDFLRRHTGQDFGSDLVRWRTWYRKLAEKKGRGENKKGKAKHHDG